MTVPTAKAMLQCKAMRVVAAASLLGALCAPASATTLVRCKIGKQTVYSDTECPESKSGTHKRRGQSEFSSGAPSRKVTVRAPRKTSVAMKVPHKSGKSSK